MKEEIFYKDQTFIKFTHNNDDVKYWCIEGSEIKEKFVFENEKPNGLERIIEIYEAELPTGKHSFGMSVNYLNSKYGFIYPGMCDVNIPDPKTYFEYKFYFFNDLLKITKSQHPDLKNVIEFLEKETTITPTLF